MNKNTGTRKEISQYGLSFPKYIGNSQIIKYVIDNQMPIFVNFNIIGQNVQITEEPLLNTEVPSDGIKLLAL